jgi:hypothetical protein
MARVTHRSRPAAGLVAFLLAFACSLAPGWAGTSSVSGAAAALPAWRGGIDLYRSGTFTTQRNWLWCTAADVQIIRNIARHQRDHGTTSQRRYFVWMRGHNRYDLPLSAGVDPAGWTAGLRHFVDDRYRLVASRTFAAALTSAVTNLRRTNLPVGITVANGNHAWILTGFTATADPLISTSFTVTSVRIVGPLFGLQSRNGYDMPPDTRLTPAQLRHYFTPWRYAPMRMIWDGRFVSVQPIPTASVSMAPAVSPLASSASGLISSPPAASSPPASMADGPGASPVSTAGAADPTSAGPTSEPAPNSSPDATFAPAATTTSSDGIGPGPAMAIVAVGLAAAVMAVGIGRSAGRNRVAPRPRPHR